MKQILPENNRFVCFEHRLKKRQCANQNFFFAKVQYRLHWAITEKITIEIIYTEADTSKLYMGLNLEDASDGKSRKAIFGLPRITCHTNILLN